MQPNCLVTLGEKISALRSDRGLTQHELASIATVSISTVHNTENDVRKPHLSNARLIARALHQTMPLTNDDIEFLAEQFDTAPTVLIPKSAGQITAEVLGKVATTFAEREERSHPPTPLTHIHATVDQLAAIMDHGALLVILRGLLNGVQQTTPPQMMLRQPTTHGELITPANPPPASEQPQRAKKIS